MIVPKAKINVDYLMVQSNVGNAHIALDHEIIHIMTFVSTIYEPIVKQVYARIWLPSCLNLIVLVLACVAG